MNLITVTFSCSDNETDPDTNNYEELIKGTWIAYSVVYNGDEIFNPNSNCAEELVFTSTTLTAEDLGDCISPDYFEADYRINGDFLILTGPFDLTQEILELTETNFVVTEPEYAYSYAKQDDPNIFGTWTLTENGNCVSTNGDMFEDNGISPITLNEDYTITTESDPSGNYISHNFTFENNTLTVNAIYQEFFSPECNEVDFKLATYSAEYTYDSETDTFTGTAESSQEEVSGTSCVEYGSTCEGTVMLTRE